MDSDTVTRSGAGRIARRLALIPLLALAACDLDLLSVETPGQVAADDLRNPALVNLLVDSAISDLECAWNQYVAGTAAISDEYIGSSGNLALRDWTARRTLSTDVSFGQGGCGGAVFPMYTPLHTARFQTANIYEKLASSDFVEVPNRVSLQATMRAYGGFALTALGEGFCEMTIPTDEGVPGPLLQPSQVLEAAERHFSEAIQLAQQAGNDDIRNMALVGRARVRLNLGNFSGVVADAAQVPAGYLRLATRDGSATRRVNYNFERFNAPDGFRQNASVAPNFRELTIAPDGRPTEGAGVSDPRVEVVFANRNGTDGVTPHFVNRKHTSQSAPVTIASHREAQLFLAEAHIRSGAIAEGIAVLNDRRAELGLPEITYTPSSSEAVSLILEERRREFFVEGGHRFNDMLRFRGTAHEIPFLGEPGSIHPDGVDHTGYAYGPMTCFPLPDLERAGNPNL